MGFISKDYCCCAIPLYQTGIYAILVETAVVSVTSGVLAFAAPHVTAIAVPGILPVIFGVVSILLGIVQLLGFYGVFREKPGLFHKYTKANLAFTCASILLALIIIIISTARHSAAVDACVAQFIEQQQEGRRAAGTVGNGGVVSGDQICNIWVWVQVGIMFLLWFILTFTQIYFYLLTRSYSVVQRKDHARYSSVFSVARDSFIRNSVDAPNFNSAPGMHSRQMSKSSSLRNEVYADEPLPDNEPGPSRRPAGQGHGASPSLGENGALLGQSGSGGYDYGHRAHQPSTSSALGRQPTYPTYEDDPYGQTVNAPPAGRLADAEPTPVVPAGGYWGPEQRYDDDGYGGSGMRYPDQAMAHPAEGAMGRKTPRYGQS